MGDESKRSLYDGDEDEPWFLRSDEDDADGEEGSALTSLTAWHDAERDQLRALAGVARLLGKLERALATQTAGQGGAARLALIEASDLLWLEGVRIRPERLWMFRADRGGEPVIDRADYTLGLWAMDRLLGDWPLDSEEDLQRFLGRRQMDPDEDSAGGDVGLAPLQSNLAARSDWVAARQAAEGLHPLTQAAYLADQWRRTSPGGRESDLEAGVIAARIAAEGGISFAPLAFGGRRRLTGAGGANAILTRFLEAAAGGAQRTLLELSRLEDWRARADAAPLKKNPAALLSLLEAEFAVTTARAGAYLGSAHQTALTSLNILRDHGLVREITGGKSFFYWTANLSPGPGPGRDAGRSR